MSKSSKIRLEVAAGTDKGLERDVNQDAVYVWASSIDLTPPRALLLVADGMGGHREGEVASKLVIDKFKESLLPGLEKGEVAAKSLEEQMVKALRIANLGVRNYALDNGFSPQDIGTTLDCVGIIGMQAYVAHVGDSRVYLLGKKGLRQITADDTAVAEMVEAGLLAPEDIYTHPQRNILTRGLGGEEFLEVEITKYDLSIGERVLVCSDGLWGMVRDPALERILLWAVPPHVVVEELIVAANEAGGMDNIGIVICDVLPA